MEAISDVKGELKGFTGFFKYVFNFDESNKALLMNMLQYALIAIIPVTLSLKGISYIIPEEDEEKGSFEILAEVLGQLLLLLLSIWFINKMIRYVPTYSGIEYSSFNETNTLIPFLILVLTMQTRLGEKIRILSDRVMDIWEGNSSAEKKEQNTNVKVSQPVSNNQGQQQSAPLVNSSTLGMNPMMNGMQQPQQMSISAQQASLTPQYQDPNFNQMHENTPVPLMDAMEPVAANDSGSPWSLW